MQQSPFENIFNIIGGFSEGNEKPMKHGFYNAFALFILMICCVAVYVLFLILEPFFKPLFWALLVGSILHPFKYKLSQKIKAWFENLVKSDSSVVYGLIVIPVNMVNFASETVGHEFKEHYKVLIGMMSSMFILPWLYKSVPGSLSSIFWQFHGFISYSITLFISLCGSYITMTFALAYIISVYTLWSPERAGIFKVTSHLLWLVVASFLASLAGSFQVYMFVILQTIGMTGFTIEVLHIQEQLELSDPDASVFTALCHVLTNEQSEVGPQKLPVEKLDEKNDTIQEEKESSNKETTPNMEPPDTPDQNVKTGYDAIPEEKESSDKESTPNMDSPDTPEQNVKTGNDAIQSSPRRAKKFLKTKSLSALPLSKIKTKPPFESPPLASCKQRSLDENHLTHDFDSDYDETAIYFKLLFSCCFCMLVWNHIWLLPVMLFFLAIHILKKLLNFFGVRLFFENRYNNVKAKVKSWWNDRRPALVPAQIRGIGKIVSSCNRTLIEVAYDSVDTVSTCIVIVGLILFVTVGTIFIFIQIYSEALVIVQLSGSLLNSTYVQHSALHSYLPEGWEENLDSLIDNAYTYGREGISTGVKNILKEGDPEKIARVEEQVLQIWDRVYQSWVTGNFAAPTVGPTVDSAAVHESWDSFVNDVTNTTALFDYGRLVSWVRANVGTLGAIAGGVWAPLASNVSLLAGSLGAATSLLLCGGGAIINMIINIVVFFTTLFYLLASSGAMYKPVEVITRAQPGFGLRLGIALSAAINQVFKASFKMALFYGLWTWFVHKLFGAKVVYLPSVLAAVLGAAPFLGPYVAGVPAALDVWLQGRALAALCLIVAQAAPIAFLDVAIYAEIKDGGHPYVTGLAIAGGIFYLGPEGAILGPLLLCCLMVVLNLSSSFLRDTPAEERADLHSRVRLGDYL